MCGAPAKQLDLELPNAAADLQDRSALNPLRGDEVDDPLRRRGQAPPLIALGLTSREAAGKDRLIIVWIAALGHAVSISLSAHPKTPDDLDRVGGQYLVPGLRQPT